MKALIHDGAGSLSLVDRPKPELMLSTDAIIKLLDLLSVPVICIF